MSSEPNLRAIENAQPYGTSGYGSQVQPRIPGTSHGADSRPRPFPDSGSDPRGRDQLSELALLRRLILGPRLYKEVWREFTDWLDELPGLFMAIVVLICAILAAPLRLLAWMFRRPITRVLGLALLLFALFIASIPLMTTSGREPRRSEGEQMLGSMKGQVRVAYSKAGRAPRTLTDRVGCFGANATPPELLGKYFEVVDRVYVFNHGEYDAAIVARPNPGNQEKGWGIMYFNWGGGDGKMEWQDRRPTFMLTQ